MALAPVADKQVEVTIVTVSNSPPLPQGLQYADLLYDTDEETRINVEPSAPSNDLNRTPHMDENDRQMRKELTS